MDDVGFVEGWYRHLNKGGDVIGIVELCYDDDGIFELQSMRPVSEFERLGHRFEFIAKWEGDLLIGFDD